VCPRDRKQLEVRDDRLVCAEGHTYAFPDGIPVLLVPDERPTHAACHVSLAEATAADEDAPLDRGIDPFVRAALGATCGHLYVDAMREATTYPIPELRLPPGDGQRFLELGSNWGRWCISAARRGYRPVGIDPSLKSIRAARRVGAQLGVDVDYVVGDARLLPFPDESFDVVFSYSVFQHFAKDDVLRTLPEIRRVLRPGGTAFVQMANRYGVRSFWNRARTRFRAPTDFEVRYWTPSELRRAFGRAIGPTTVEVDGFFSLNAQASDLALLPPRYRPIVRASDVLRRASQSVPLLTQVADSVYVRSLRSP
jgi:SAM-dependent methyltransferase/uncharacterized protein YbaR (Trm112 family)